jgi:hypothetical protein
MHKPGVRVDPPRPELLASVMTIPDRRIRVGPLLLAVALLSAAAAEAGWLIVDHRGDQTLRSRGRLKIAARQADGHAMVLDLGRARLWVADRGRRLYWDGTVEEYCQATRAAMPASEETPATPPTSERGGAPPRVAVEPTAETETIAALPTRKYRVLVDGALYEELWLTSEASLVRELELGRAPETFGRMFACMSGGGQRVEATAEYRQLFARGWPLKVVYHAEGGRALRALVTRVEERDIPEGDFTPPPGFRTAPLTEIFGRR